MRILHLTESLGRGGKERQLAELLRGMIPHDDIESFVAVIDKEEHHYEIDSEFVQILQLFRTRKRDLSIFKRLYDLVSTLKVDVIHSWGSMCSIYAAPVAKLCG